MFLNCSQLESPHSMRTFNEKVKQFVENNFEKIVKIFFIQEKMPDFRRFIPNQIFLFFSLFCQFVSPTRFENRQKPDSFGRFLSNQIRFVDLFLTKMLKCAPLVGIAQLGGSITYIAHIFRLSSTG